MESLIFKIALQGLSACVLRHVSVGHKYNKTIEPLEVLPLPSMRGTHKMADEMAD